MGSSKKCVMRSAMSFELPDFVSSQSICPQEIRAMTIASGPNRVQIILSSGNVSTCHTCRFKERLLSWLCSSRSSTYTTSASALRQTSGKKGRNKGETKHNKQQTTSSKQQTTNNEQRTGPNSGCQTSNSGFSTPNSGYPSPNSGYSSLNEISVRCEV